ncbi:MAG: ankyrin repeat domain-containing protein, partial [Bacteriovoracaceae bacterium]|nr:ankyrin repeat domain-containing protein [Bacteriovoracaceae bacterium]
MEIKTFFTMIFIFLSLNAYCESSIDKVDKHGTNALYRAAQKGEVQVVKKLIDNGAQVEVSKLKHSPLVAASMMGNYEVVEILLKNGAKTNPKVSKTTYLLDEIKNSKNIRMITLFRKYGAKFK